MIGVRLTENATGHPVQVVAEDGPFYVVARTDAFASPVRETAASLSANYTSAAGADAPVPEPVPVDEQEGWQAIGAHAAKAAEALARGAVPAAATEPTPEDHFAGIERITADEAARLGHGRR